MFGLTTHKELDAFRKNVINLSKSQEQLFHVVNESLSNMQTSRFEIQENRHKIVELIVSLQQLDNKLDALNETLQTQISETSYFLEIYVQLDIIIKEIQSMLQGDTLYLDGLKMKIDMLSLQQVTPSIIMPSDLQFILKEIRIKLPPSLRLTHNPETEIWKMYKYLRCTALFDSDHIVIAITVRLLGVGSEYEVYWVYNLPMPIITDKVNFDMTRRSNGHIASYNLETNGFLIDKARTRFVLLTDNEIQACSSQKARWCTLDSAIFPVALSRLCVINLFIGSQAYHQQYCEAVVTIDTKLPMASSLFGNYWAIVTRDNLTFGLVCATGESTTDVVQVHNPVGIISVPPSCVASNRFMLISAHNQYQGQVSLTDRDQLLLQTFNISNIDLWLPLKDHFPNATSISVKIPELLPEVKRIGMGELIKRLSELQSGKQILPRWSIYKYLLVGVATVVVICVMVVVILAKYKIISCSVKKLMCGFWKTVLPDEALT